MSLKVNDAHQSQNSPFLPLHSGHPYESGKTAHADSATRRSANSIYTSTELPPPERGLVVLQDNGKNDRCVSVRVKGSSSSWKQKLPRLFESEDGSVISAQDNNNLANSYLHCLRTRNLLKK